MCEHFQSNAIENWSDWYSYHCHPSTVCHNSKIHTRTVNIEQDSKFCILRNIFLWNTYLLDDDQETHLWIDALKTWNSLRTGIYTHEFLSWKKNLRGALEWGIFLNRLLSFIPNGIHVPLQEVSRALPSLINQFGLCGNLSCWNAILSGRSIIHLPPPPQISEHLV